MNIGSGKFGRCLAILALVAGVCGCSDDNGTNITRGQGQVVLVMHDAPVDDLKEAWLTVESVTLISESDSSHSEVLLSDGIRMDFLALDSISQVLATANVQSGTYSKIRLQVSEPEFVRNDDSVFTEPDVHLVANGHVDLNPQGAITIDADSLHVISLDLDLDNSIQVNQTGNGRYILRPQIFIDGDEVEDGVEDGEVTIRHATILSLDLLTGELIVSVPSSPDDLTVVTSSETEIKGDQGATLTLDELAVGLEIKFEGELDLVSGSILASMIKFEN